ncbi:MBL fold metallo-hydrolase [Clostridium sp. LP20]|uniref:MBL fold metallo-hydrolase n=1 Tax=Clostridium sp. LP20 TaxID=3418665 RepID=UPI003EE6ECD5
MNEIHTIRVECVGFINYVNIIVDLATKEAAIIDPAWNLSEIIQKINEIGCEITTILLTHSHIDHVNLVNELILRTNAKVYMSEKEIEVYNFSSHNLNKLLDKEIIEVGKTKIIALLTPGHTEGSMCYLTSKALFTGDTVFIEGCGICNSIKAASDMYNSLNKIRTYVDENILVYPGHCYYESYGYPLKKINKDNIYFLIDNEQEFIKFRMRKNQKKLLDFI